MKKSISYLKFWSLYVQTEVAGIASFILLCARNMVLSADTLQ